ncbi:hypothetical protein KC365_g18988, partial [Hortaea werneckii]
MDQEVAELLEQEERKVTERNAAKQRKNSDDATSPASTTSRANGHSDRASQRKIPDRRDPRNRYSAEREENDARRSRKSKDLAEDDDDDEGSANGSDRSRPTRKRSRSPDRDRRRRSRDTYRERD